MGQEMSGRYIADIDEYQRQAKSTAVYPDIGGIPEIYPALGLADEAGEVLGTIKKLYRDHDGEKDPEFYGRILKEMGDVYWYLAMLADELGIASSEIISANVKKLQDRAERGVLRGDGDNR